MYNKTPHGEINSVVTSSRPSTLGKVEEQQSILKRSWTKLLAKAHLEAFFCACETEERLDQSGFSDIILFAYGRTMVVDVR